MSDNKPESQTEKISSLYFKVIQNGKDALKHLSNKLKEMKINEN